MPAYKKAIFTRHVIPNSRNVFMNPQDDFRVDEARRMVVIPGGDGMMYSHPFEIGVSFVFEEDKPKESGKK